jgi:hypothetical protein
LQQFPLPPRDERLEGRVADLVLARQGSDEESRQEVLDKEIETIVKALYERK